MLCHIFLVLISFLSPLRPWCFSGVCQDYTNNPEANKHPDSSNFEFLAELYGVTPGSAVNGTSQSVPGDEAKPEGKKPMTGDAFLRGRGLGAGDRFE